MRAYLPAYEIVQPRRLDEALALLASGGGWRPLAGGTDLMVLLDSGTLPRGGYVSIWGLDELKAIDETSESLSIGALATYTDIRASDTIEREFPMLCRAAECTGGIAIQNRGTIGGNIANASPAADSPPALLAYDAEIELASARGFRRVPYRLFHRGYKQIDLAEDELIARIVLPKGRHAGWKHCYRKVGTRGAQAISKVCFAGLVDAQHGVVREVRLAFGSVAPVPLRCAQAEAALRGAPLDHATIDTAGEALSADISPIDDLRSSADYRRRVAGNLLSSFLAAADER